MEEHEKLTMLADLQMERVSFHLMSEEQSRRRDLERTERRLRAATVKAEFEAKPQEGGGGKTHKASTLLKSPVCPWATQEPPEAATALYGLPQPSDAPDLPARAVTPDKAASRQAAAPQVMCPPPPPHAPQSPLFALALSWWALGGFMGWGMGWSNCM